MPLAYSGRTAGQLHEPCTAAHPSNAPQLNVRPRYACGCSRHSVSQEGVHALRLCTTTKPRYVLSGPPARAGKTSLANHTGKHFRPRTWYNERQESTRQLTQ